MDTPRAGVWIEMHAMERALHLIQDTPRAGVWIEIAAVSILPASTPTLPVRECGLKCALLSGGDVVTGHSPCGSVD